MIDVWAWMGLVWEIHYAAAAAAEMVAVDMEDPFQLVENDVVVPTFPYLVVVVVPYGLDAAM